jgi:hypothetical protein
MKENMRRILSLSSYLLVGVLAAPAAEAPRTFGLSAPALLAARVRLAGGDARLAAPLAQLRAEADKLLALKPASVMDKTRVPAGADRHDYFSLAPYWWPDPAKPDGLPYIRHDGRINPDSKKGTDSVAFAHTCNAVETLGLAFWFTGDERYAQKAATLTRVWFLDPATRMNPNLEHSQAVWGINDGRGAGILEARHLVGLNDGLALLAGSAAWRPADADALKAWLTEYYHWLTTSKSGRNEAASNNNHGSWYDVQAAGLALVLGREDDAKKIFAAAPKRRIAAQIEPDGRQPLELARTKSLNYFLFNLEALFRLSRMGEHAGLDLWSFSTTDGRSLQQALLYVAPYADPAKNWPKEDIETADRARILPLLAEGAAHYNTPSIRETLAKFSGRLAPDERWRLVGANGSDPAPRP